MGHYLVAVMDGTLARFFTLDSDAVVEHEAGPNLVEHDSLQNAAQQMQGQELWANTKTGQNRGDGGQMHNYDDHRAQHRMEFERRFAQAIANHLL